MWTIVRCRGGNVEHGSIKLLISKVISKPTPPLFAFFGSVLVVRARVICRKVLVAG